MHQRRGVERRLFGHNAVSLGAVEPHVVEHDFERVIQSVVAFSVISLVFLLT